MDRAQQIAMYLAQETGVLLGPVCTSTRQRNIACIKSQLHIIMSNHIMQHECTLAKMCMTVMDSQPLFLANNTRFYFCNNISTKTF